MYSYNGLLYAAISGTQYGSHGICGGGAECSLNGIFAKPTVTIGSTVSASLVERNAYSVDWVKPSIYPGFNTDTLSVDAFTTEPLSVLKLRGSVTLPPVFEIVVIPPTVLKFIPVPAARFCDIFPVILSAVMSLDTERF